MRTGSRAWRRLFLTMGVAALVAVGTGCGDDDEPTETVTETVETETEPTEIETDETLSEPETETEIPTGTEAPTIGSEKEASREIVNMLRAFNRTANQGRLQEACQNYFSEAFLARLPTERACATTLAGARGGRGKVQMDVEADRVRIDEETGTAEVGLYIGEVTGAESIRRAFRNIDLVFEDGSWKIDAVNTGPL